LIVHARTLREALVDLIQHAPAVLRCARFKLREEATHASLQYDAPLRDPIAAQFRAEVALSLALRAVRNFASSAAPSVLSLRRLAQESDRHLRETLGCEIRYDAPVNEITLQRGLLDQPNMFVDAELYELYKRHAEGRMRAENAAWHVRAKAVLRHELNLDSVDYAVVARRLSVTPRALRRRLSSEGYSLTALTNEVRREIAVEDLAMSSRPIKEIAERLGFSEVSAFHRAFRRWTHGETPARYRMAAQSALRPSS
jgi:AraC-like DNA-binding protein/HEPN domain-containing protein